MLKEQLKYVRGDEYVESEARNKLGLARENEYIVFAPKEKTKKENLQILLKLMRLAIKKCWDLF